jgi:hypothetical protein
MAIEYLLQANETLAKTSCYRDFAEYVRNGAGSQVQKEYNEELDQASPEKDKVFDLAVSAKQIKKASIKGAD